MGKTIIQVACTDQRLSAISSPLIASGGRGEDMVEFEFCPLWDGFEKTAVFYRFPEVAYHAVIVDNKCVIPHEVLRDEGAMYFGVFGAKDDIVRTSEVLRYNISKGAITKGTAPSDPTPDIYAQVLARLGAIENSGGGMTTEQAEQLEQNTADIAQLSEEIEALMGDDKPSEVTYEPDIDGYMRNDGTIWQTTYCYHTDYIPLDGYNRVVAKTYLIATGYALAFFDATKKLIPEASIAGAGGSGMPNHIDMRVPRNAAYCMLSNYLGSDGTNYAFVTLYADDDIVDSALYGRSINVLGDSISSDDYFTPNYWQLISEKTGCGFNDYAVSASRIATVEGDSPKSFLTRAAEMDTTADAVLVMGGTNDCNLKTLLGEWNSGDESTFYGALNALISLLRTNFPGKPIIFCTPIKRKYDTDNGFPDTMADLKAASATEQITMQHCVLAIKAKCARHGIPVIDLAEHSGFSALTPEYYYSETDNLHPSALGHVRIANMVQAELEKQFLHTAE